MNLRNNNGDTTTFPKKVVKIKQKNSKISLLLNIEQLIRKEVGWLRLILSVLPSSHCNVCDKQNAPFYHINGIFIKYIQLRLVEEFPQRIKTCLVYLNSNPLVNIQVKREVYIKKAI